jgi:hypothetical protein
MKHLFGMDRFAQNVLSKVQSGTENIAIIALPILIGMRFYSNVLLVHLAKSIIQLKTFVFVLLKLLSCLRMELASFVTDQSTGTKETKLAKLVEKD